MSKKLGAVWAKREDKNGKYEVRVPPNTGFDFTLIGKRHLPEPFDSLSLDWANELVHYMAENRLKLYKEPLGNGRIEYRLRDEMGELVLTLESSRNNFVDTRRKRGRRKRR